MQGEIVNATLQGNDPTIQKILRRHALAPKVVNDQRPTVGFHLKWRFVKLCRFTPGKIGILKCQLAADYDHRPPNQHPTVIVLGGRNLIGRMLVTVRIEYTDYLAVDLYRVGNPDS